jgi:hypothetical protein
MKEELAWEFHSGTWCEFSTPYNIFGTRHALCRLKVNATSSQFEWHVAWQNIIQEYTGKSLTFTSDIYPALQGLAKKGTDVLGRYLAGL